MRCSPGVSPGPGAFVVGFDEQPQAARSDEIIRSVDVPDMSRERNERMRSASKRSNAPDGAGVLKELFCSCSAWQARDTDLLSARASGREDHARSVAGANWDCCGKPTRSNDTLACCFALAGKLARPAQFVVLGCWANAHRKRCR